MDEQQIKINLYAALVKLKSRLTLSAITSAETNDFDKLEKEMGWIQLICVWLNSPILK